MDSLVRPAALLRPRPWTAGGDDPPLPDLQIAERTALAHGRSVGNAIVMMRARLAEPISLRALAGAACMSPFHFSRVFRSLTGMPPSQFLWALRLNRAKTLLAQTGLSVTEICFEVGYQSFGTFITRFHNLVGVAPSAFREAHAACRSTELGQIRGWLLDQCHSCLGDGPPDCEIATPEGFDGIVFIALFNDRLPAGAPVSCRIVAAPARCRLGLPAGGRQSILSLGASWSSTLGELLVVEKPFPVGRPSSAPRGAGGCVRIALRPPTLFDPPLLTAFPLVVANSLRACGDAAIRKAI